MSKRIDLVKTGENLRHLCRERNLTATQIAERLLLSDKRIVYYWFAGRNLPSVDRIYELADILNVLVDDILVPTEKNEKWYFAYFRYIQDKGFLPVDRECQYPTEKSKGKGV